MSRTLADAFVAIRPRVHESAVQDAKAAGELTGRAFGDAASKNAASAGERTGREFGAAAVTGAKKAADRDAKGMGVTIGEKMALGVGAGLSVGLPLVGSAAAVGLVASMAAVGVAIAAQNEQVKAGFSVLAQQVTTGMTTAAAPLVPFLLDVAGQASTAFATFLPAVTGAFTALGPALQAGLAPFMAGLTQAFVSLAEATARSAPMITDIMTRLGQLLPTVVGLVVALIELGGNAIDPLLAVINALVGGLTTVIGWMDRYQVVTIAVAAALAALVTVSKVHAAVLTVQAAGGLAKYLAGLNLVKAATLIWTGVQWALNFALTANPIGLIIVGIAALVAGVILAWRHSQTFRTVVVGAWDAIKVAAQFMWSVIKVVFGLWLDCYKLIGGAALWLWRNAILPAFEGVVTAVTAVGSAFVWLWQNIIAPAVSAIASQVTWLWRNIIEPAWTGISFIIQVVWTVIQIVFGLWMIYYKLIGETALWLWRHGVQPAFEGVAAVVLWAWDAVIRPTFDAFAAVVVWVVNQVIRPVMDALVWFWRNAVVPAALFLRDMVRAAIEAMGQAIQFVSERVIRPTMDALVWFWRNAVVPAALFLRDMVRAAIEAMGQAIQFTWDHTIRPVMDAIAFVIRDVVPTAFRVGVDAIARAWDLLREAAKVPVRFVVDVVMNPLIRGYNKIASSFGVNTVAEIGLPFVTGGIYPGYSPGRDIGLAAVSGYEAIMRPEWTRAVGPAYVHGANAAARTGGVPGVRAWLAGGFADGGIVGDLLGWVTDPVGRARDALGGPLNRLRELSNTPFSQMIAAMPRRIYEAAVAKVESIVKGFGSSLGFGGGGVERWRGVALSALSLAGAPASWIGSLLRRMNQESGGNPMAINLWDSNAMRGTPSKGLMQVIQPTFNAYAGPLRDRGIWDPLANIFAAIRYTIARYGSGPAGWDRPGGYARGGIVGDVRSLSMDGGFGVLRPGPNMVFNGTGRDEPITSGPVEVRVYIGDRELTDITRVEVERINRQVARQLAGSRTTGNYDIL